MFPKILLLAHLNKRNPVGITVFNMFQLWPNDKIAVASFDIIEDIYRENWQNYYCLGKMEVSFRFFPFLNKRIADSIAYSTNGHPIEKLNINTYKQSKNNSLLIKKALSVLSIKTGLAIFKYKYQMSKEFLSWINSFNPEIIYCTMEDFGRLKFIAELKKNINKKIVIHIMDDWIHTVYDGVLFTGLLRKRIIEEFKKLLGNSDLNLVISDKMADEYKNRYDKMFYQFHNPVNLILWKTEAKHRLTKKDFEFVYVGKIGKDHADAVNKFIRIIKEIQAKHPVSFKIFTNTAIDMVKKFIGKSNMRDFYFGSIEYVKVPSVLAAADGLFLPLSFNKLSVKYTRLSIPTKLTEYMVSFSPILCFAPEETALAEYVKKNECAFLVTDKTELKKATLQFINNQIMRKKIANKAYETVLVNYDIKRSTLRLNELLQIIIE